MAATVDHSHRPLSHPAMDAICEDSLADSGSKPLAVVCTATEDHNGALEPTSHRLAEYTKLARLYILKHMYVQSSEDMERQLEEISSSFDVFKRLSLLVINAHGYPDRIRLSPDKMLDSENISFLARYIDERARIILYSCNTGRWGKGGASIAAHLSTILPDVKVTAPLTTPNRLTLFTDGKLNPRLYYGDVDITYVFGEESSELQSDVETVMNMLIDDPTIGLVYTRKQLCLALTIAIDVNEIDMVRKVLILIDSCQEKSINKYIYKTILPNVDYRHNTSIFNEVLLYLKDRTDTMPNWQYHLAMLIYGLAEKENWDAIPQILNFFESNVENAVGRALALAIASDRLDIVKGLVEINIVPQNGPHGLGQALCHAAQLGHEEIVRYFIGLNRVPLLGADGLVSISKTPDLPEATTAIISGEIRQLKQIQLGKRIIVRTKERMVGALVLYFFAAVFFGIQMLYSRRD